MLTRLEFLAIEKVPDDRILNSTKEKVEIASTSPNFLDIDTTENMSDQVKELLDIPQDFVRNGMFFMNRCTKPNKQGQFPARTSGHEHCELT